MLVVQDKSISLLWQLKAIFMLFLRKEFYCIDHRHGANKKQTKSEKHLLHWDARRHFYLLENLYFLLFLIAKRAREENNYLNVEMTKQTSTDGPPHQTEEDLDELLQDYKSFHDSWVERCKRLHGKPYGC